MTDSVDSERPAKRIKHVHALTQPPRFPPQPKWYPHHEQVQHQDGPSYQDLNRPQQILPPAAQHIAAPSSDATMATSMAPGDRFGPAWSTVSFQEPGPGEMHDISYPHLADSTEPWSSSTTIAPSIAGGSLPPTDMVFSFSEPEPVPSIPFHDSDWEMSATISAPSGPPSLPFDVNHAESLDRRDSTLARSQPSQPHLPRLLPATAATESSNPPPSPISSTSRRKSRSKNPLISPFQDCIGVFGQISEKRFTRPDNGQVNGYVKFNWPQERAYADRSAMAPAARPTEDVSNELMPRPRAVQSSALDKPVDIYSPMTTAGHSSMPPVSPTFSDISTVSISRIMARSGAASPSNLEIDAQQLTDQDHPRFLPSGFGMGAKMDSMDRRFWDFYIRNWCPGRSILHDTNLWLKDFGQMQSNDGVRAAIQSLAGVYIYDYQPTEQIRQRVNDRFAAAENRLSQLLNDQAAIEADQGSEVISLSVILSMQDVILTERRRKKPYNARWLQGFKQGEQILQMTDPGSRFWRENNVQLTSLRISQSIMIGRTVILAQPMMVLPSPQTFDFRQEAKRFDWLLYGTKEEMYEIHGGCGFSKSLLHIVSQITYCAARLQQDKDSLVVPMTIKYLMTELESMRQWSRETRDWETAKQGEQAITWVRKMPEGYVIQDAHNMTDVSAEAWRIAAVIYLQCRAMRLPRRHPDVLANLNDLAKCIRLMPTSGLLFTAQAPLLPVFLLGLMATDDAHMATSRTWFERVVRTPVRSSVPPLYNTLKRIWDWPDSEIESSPQPPTELPASIGDRVPWWEKLVAKVTEKEDETLCLT